MSEVKVNKISPRTNCGTVTLGDSGDTFTIPSGATITNNGTQTGFGRTGTVDWVTTVQTSTITAATGKGYFVNTTAGTITANLPAGSAGSIVSFADYAATWDDNNFTISPNGSDKIGGVNADVTLSTEGQSVTLVYIDSTQGWINTMDSTSNVRGEAFITATGGTITTSGNCRIHKFTGPGTFCVSSLATVAANNQVSYIVVAGGAGGGGTASGSWGAGGGGAGGFREDKSPTTPYTSSPLEGAGAITVTATGFPITVGAGGGAAPNSSGTATGTVGGNSIFSTITSTGGGGGGAGAGPGTAGANGGSGGGGGSSNGAGAKAGGSGNTPPVSPSQGNNGGSSGDGDKPAAGGGGATAVGSNAVPGTPSPQPGGAGAATSIIASPVTYSAGGASGNWPAGAGTAGAANTGNGGGGGGGASWPDGNGAPSAAGGSGIVIIRYKYQ
jgi:hypothetical protein